MWRYAENMCREARIHGVCAQSASSAAYSTSVTGSSHSLLVSSPGHIFTRQQLMDEIWGLDSTTDERTVDVHVNRLRERFKNCDDFIIMTVRGLGYKAVKTEA